MTFRDLQFQFQNALATGYDTAEIDSFFYLSLEHLHALKRLDLALEPQLLVPDEALEKWFSILEQLKAQKPIQYILGEASFCDLIFKVTENTLIPRPETEELVFWITEALQSSGFQNPKILDIGTGTGCIPIALQKKLPFAEVFALDVSAAALEVARENAQKNQAAVTFFQHNILEVDRLDSTYDVLVSNPPYVREMEQVEIKPNVLNYEPHLALFVPDSDPLLFYRKIAALAGQHLSLNGLLFFEINQYLGESTVALLHEMGFSSVVLRKDIYGNDRMILAKR